MGALIAIGRCLAGQYVQAVQAELAIAGIQSNYVAHAEIRLCGIWRALLNQTLIVQRQLLILGIGME